MHRSIIASLSALALVRAQQVGTNTAESHPSLAVSKCSKSGGCTSATQSIVLDANWRWLHSTSSLTNCYTGNTWDTALCPDATTCAKNCALEGADYTGTYGITASGSSVKLNYVTTGSSGSPNVGSRVYLMADASHYQMFNLLNQEFTFDVDMSQLPCGVNGALYFSQMDADGGAARFPTNAAGAKYGTGYCDSQCPQDMKFIDGLANSANWNSSTTSPNVGHGQWGTCCDEMDIWEANSNAAAYTPHPCSTTEQTLCTTASGNCSSTCDQAGCDFNSWRMGDQTFLGPGLTVDTKSKFTVVTQFITDTGTSSGTLTEIKRYYVQNGKTIPNSYSTFPTLTSYNSITDDFCAAQKTEFDDSNVFAQKGGLAKMGKAFQTGMVLVMSIWDDTAAQCLWLDSDYPTTADPSSPGINRGPCPTTSGDPKTTEQQYPNAYVTFSNIKYGDLNSTFTNTGSTGGTSPGSTGTTTSKPAGSKTTTSKPVSSTPPATGGGTVAQWGQCGGIGYNGATKCVSPYTCHVSNPYYSQCY